MPSPLTDSCNLLGKISFFSAQEKILVVPITRKTKSSAGHQRLPEAGNNVQGAQWRSPSREAEGEQREDTGPGLSGPWGRGMTDRGTWKKRSPPPQSLEVRTVKLYPGNDSRPSHIPERSKLLQLRCSESTPLLPSWSPSLFSWVLFPIGTPPPGFWPCLPTAASLGNFPLRVRG